MSEPSADSVTSFSTRTPVTIWNQDWANFRDQFDGWHSKFPSELPIYSLPENLIAHRPTLPLRARTLFEKDDAAAELAFHELCERHICVGVWNNLPVVFHLLRPAKLLIDLETFKGLGGNETGFLQIQRSFDKLAIYRDRLQGVLGYMLTDPIFLKHRDELKTQWEALLPPQRPSFPLARSVKYPSELPDSVQASAEWSGFSQTLTGFLDRWGLMSLVTWDLPDPQGPLLPDPLPPNAPARPAHGVFIYLPFHYPMQGDDDLLRLILENQIQKARELGNDASFAGLPHFNAYGAMFEILWLERVVRSRFSLRNEPRGFVALLEEAVASKLLCGMDKVKKYRLGIRKCLSGQRAQVKWLTVKR